LVWGYGSSPVARTNQKSLDIQGFFYFSMHINAFLIAKFYQFFTPTHKKIRV
jgi:hypothetical protein